jgi:hypothetical protein
LVYTFSERTTDKAHIREIVRKANKVVGCVWGIGEKKWGGNFRRRDLGMEGTRRGRKSARKIFERGARSGKRNTRLHNERRVSEE